jgi:hypothetical protein
MNENNPLRAAANHLASKGRYGDTMMVHMNPIEVDMLASLSPTGELTTNPDTGQKEAFLPLLFSMAAPALLGGAMPALAASALGTGLGTIAEGGSLKEGITAGLMGGITGGLMDKFIGGSEMFKDLGKTAGEGAQQLGTLPEGFVGPPAPSDYLSPSQIGGNMGSLGAPTSVTQGLAPTITPPAADPSFLQRMGSGVTDALSPENIGQTAGSLGAGLVGEAYVPWDTPDAIAEEESEYQYEGPYMPTEQRRMIGPVDPLASAFEGEQMMLEGDVLPEGYNMRPLGYNYGGLVKRLNKGGMADKQGQIEAMAAEQRMKGDLINRMLGDRPLIPENRISGLGDMPLPRTMPMPERMPLPRTMPMPERMPLPTGDMPMPTRDMPMPRRIPMPTRDDIPSSSTMPHGKDWIPRTDEMPPLTRKKLMEPVR